MNANIPSAEEVRSWLQPMTYAQVRRLSELSGVPLTTLWNIRANGKWNPRIDTVSKFAPHIGAARAEAE